MPARPLWPLDLQPVAKEPSVKSVLAKFGVHAIDDLGPLPGSKIRQLNTGLDALQGLSSKFRRALKDLMGRVASFQRVRRRPAGLTALPRFRTAISTARLRVCIYPCPLPLPETQSDHTSR